MNTVHKSRRACFTLMQFELLGRHFGYEGGDRVPILVKHLVLLPADMAGLWRSENYTRA